MFNVQGMELAMSDGKNSQPKFDLGNRLEEFGVLIVGIAEKMPNTRAGSYISTQLIRSGLSPIFNYGEAQSAESRNDFVHKLKIVTKELRETKAAFKLTYRLGLLKDDSVTTSIKESDELIAIFVKSIETAKEE